jgi:CheY-like chemotaxis protein
MVDQEGILRMIRDDLANRSTQAAGRALLAHLRHELRTPLNAIVGYSEMLLEDASPASSPHLLEGLKEIRESGVHLISLINEILDPAKSEPGMPAPDLEEIESTIRLRLRVASQAVIARSEELLRMAKTLPEPHCLADLEHIRTAGLKFVSIIEERNFLTEGAPGIPCAIPDTPGGSDSPQEIDSPASAYRPPIAFPAYCAPASLLVVDDSETNRDILTRYLERHGHQVTGAAGGNEALAFLASRPFDLILLDVMMPDIDGYRVLARMKGDEAWSQIPVIFISALDDTLGKVQAFRAGGADYVTKPFHAEEVIARVENQLRLSRLQKDLSLQNRELMRKNEELTQAQQRTDLVFSALAEALPGTVLDGKYRLEEKIGTGGYGAVFRARHLSLDRPVAIKVFRPKPGNDTCDALARFRREGISASRIKHPNTVEILDNGISSTGIAYLVMELLNGRTLAAELQICGTLSRRRAIQIIAPVCEILAEFHAAGIVHRDIKPENIFLHQDRGNEVVKLLDFGLSKVWKTDSDETGDALTMTGGVAGTPAYIAPERLLGRSYDGRSDVYSLGVMVYRMLCGHLPFQSQEKSSYAQAVLQLTEKPIPIQACPDVSTDLEVLIGHMLAKDPEERPTANDLVGRIHGLA